MKTEVFEWNGYTATVLIPDSPNGKWIWKTEFFHEFEQAEVALFDRGYTRVYYQISDKFGSASAVRLMRSFHEELLKRYPSLHVQFGLHATSVKNRLEYLRKLDKRVRIVWEDCGAFPYAYKGTQIEGFEQTRTLTQGLMKLRGENERFGAVLKGMLNLDWQNFKHAKESVVIGESTQEFIKTRQVEKNRLWKIVQAHWLKNAEYAKILIADIAKNGKDTILQALVEDGVFENEIMFPVALYADLLWNPRRDIGEIIENVSKYPCVKFANL